MFNRVCVDMVIDLCRFSFGRPSDLLLFIGFKPLEFFDNIYFELGTDPHALLPSDYGEFAIIKSRYSAISVSQIFGIVASSIASS